MKVAGVDGYKGGWVSVLLQEGSFLDAVASKTFEAVLEAHEDAQIVAVDIPIGLSRTGQRLADREARKFLVGQGSTVFPTPPYAAIAEATYQTASLAAYRSGGKYLSRQSYSLFDRIREVDALTRPGDKVFEVHPEVSFCALAGSALPHPKKTWNGQMLRRSLLEKAGIVLPGELGSAARVRPDDVLDAAAAAWSAMRIARGEARSLPDPPELLPDGRQAAIWY